MMTWEIASAIAGIAALYFGGIFAVARFITKPIEKRIDDLKMQMTKDHQNLDDHLTRVEEKIDNHIADYSIHNIS